MDREPFVSSIYPGLRHRLPLYLMPDGSPIDYAAGVLCRIQREGCEFPECECACHRMVA